MAITFGLFAMLLGVVLLVIGILRLTATRKYAVEIIVAAVVLIGIAIYLLHIGAGQGIGRVPVGISMLLVGVVLISFGCWTALWGPPASRNSIFGLKFIFLGLGLIILGILIITVPGNNQGSFHSQSYSESNSSGRSHRVPFLWNTPYNMEGVPFGVFALVLFLVGNITALIRGLSGKDFLRANIIIAAMIMAIYMLGPFIWPRTW